MSQDLLHGECCYSLLAIVSYKMFRRLPLAFQFLFIFILYATVPWLPESPRWLMAHGQVEEAEQIIADLENTAIDDPWVITESKEIQYAVSSHLAR